MLFGGAGTRTGTTTATTTGFLGQPARGTQPTQPTGGLGLGLGMQPTQPAQPAQPTQPTGMGMGGQQPQVDPQRQQGLLQVQQAIDTVNKLQEQPELLNLVILLRHLQAEWERESKKACSLEGLGKEADGGGLRAVKDKCSKIRNRNQRLLVRLLNLREKFVHQMYMHRVQGQRDTTEFEHLTERIRHLKLQVSSKYTQLRQWQVGRVAEKTAEPSFSPLLRPVMELRKGTELLEKETIRLREELQLLVQSVHGQPL